MASLFLALIFAFADRFSGGGFFWNKLGRDHGGVLRGRPLFYAALISALLTGLLISWPAALVMSLTFAIWRGPGWKIGDHGGLTPQSVVDIVATAIRHALILIVVPLAFWNGFDASEAIRASVGFVVGSTMLQILYARAVKQGRDIGALVEIVRGAIFGAFLGMLF